MNNITFWLWRDHPERLLGRSFLGEKEKILEIRIKITHKHRIVVR